MSGNDMADRKRGIENTNLADVQEYLKIHADSILKSDRPFCNYMKEIIKQKK